MRRTWVWAVLGVVLVLAAAIPLWLVLDDGGGDRRAAALTSESRYAANWNLEIDGQPAGLVQSVAGCTTQGETIATKTPDGMTKKHLAGLQHEPCLIEVAGLSLPLRAWIQASLQQNYVRKTVALNQRNADGTPGVRLTLQQTLLTGFGLPEIKAAESKAIVLQIGLTPEAIQRQADAGQAATEKPPQTMARFRFDLEGTTLRGATAIAPWTATLKFAESSIGELRDYQIQPGQWEFDDLNLRVNAIAKDSGVPALDQFFESFVVQGNADDAQEKSGSLVLLDVYGTKTLLTLNFSHLGIRFREPANGADGARGFGFYVENAMLQ